MRAQFTRVGEVNMQSVHAGKHASTSILYVTRARTCNVNTVGNSWSDTKTNKRGKKMIV